MEKYERKNNVVMSLGIVLAVMFLFTFLLLFITSLAMYRFDLSVTAAKVVVIITYVLSGLIGGFLIGRKMKERKYLWGLAVGGIFFFMILIVSLAVNKGGLDASGQIFLKGMLCILSSMIGGMIS